MRENSEIFVPKLWGLPINRVDHYNLSLTDPGPLLHGNENLGIWTQNWL